MPSVFIACAAVVELAAAVEESSWLSDFSREGGSESVGGSREGGSDESAKAAGNDRSGGVSVMGVEESDSKAEAVLCDTLKLGRVEDSMGEN